MRELEKELLVSGVAAKTHLRFGTYLLLPNMLHPRLPHRPLTPRIGDGEGSHAVV